MASSASSDAGSDPLDANDQQQQQISKIEIEPYYPQYDQPDEPETVAVGTNNHSNKPPPASAAVDIEYVQCSAGSDALIGETTTIHEVDMQPHSNDDDDSNLGAEFRSDFFAQLEARAAAAVLPVYLKHLLTLNGYDNVIAFSTLDASDVQLLERFGRTELLDLLRQLVPTLRQDQLPRFFHLFWRNPSAFRILPGHRQLLLQLAKYCDELWSNRWPPAAATAAVAAGGATDLPPMERVRAAVAVAVAPKLEQLTDAHEYMDESMEPQPEPPVASAAAAPGHSDHDDDNDDDEKPQPVHPIAPHIDLIDVVNRSLRAHFSLDTIGRVLIRRANAKTGKVQCSVCQHFVKLSFRGPPDDRRPVVSNIMRHVKKHFTNGHLARKTRCAQEERRSNGDAAHTSDEDGRDSPAGSPSATAATGGGGGVVVSSVVTKSDADLLRFANRIIEKNLRGYPKVW